MSQEDVEVVQAAYDAVGRRDFDALSRMLSPGFEYESPRTGRTYAGPTALREVVEEMEEVFADYHQEVERLIEAGEDRVVASVRLTGVAKGSGIPANQLFAFVWTVRAGKLVHGTAHYTLAEALEAVGLSE